MAKPTFQDGRKPVPTSAGHISVGNNVLICPCSCLGGRK